MSAKVLLVTPPYHAGVVESAGRWPHLGFIYMAGSLRAAGHDVVIYDAMSTDDTLDDIRRHIREVKPKVVAVSAKTPSLYAAIDTLRVAKEEDPETLTLIGGVHPTFCYREILTQWGEVVDFAVRGEGERTFVELMTCLQAKGFRAPSDVLADLSRVPGIAFRSGGEVIATPTRPMISNLDELTPAWDLVEWSDYKLHFIPESRVATVSSSRGCVNECLFCSQQKFWDRSHRMRSPESFLNEAAHLHEKYGVNYFLLTDEYPTRDRRRWLAILDGLIARNMDAHFLVETCVTDILRDADIMDKYAAAGILHIYVGVEGARQERVDRFKKNLACEQSRRAIKVINDAGIISETSFILGLPEETAESIRDTLELAMEYDPDYAHFLMLAPWPFADMYKELEPYIETHDLSKYNLVEPVIKPTMMTRDELFQQAIECYRKFYMRKLPQWFTMSSGLKRYYLIGSMKAMLQHSFLRKHGQGLGKIPAEVEKYLSKLKSITP